MTPPAALGCSFFLGAEHSESSVASGPSQPYNTPKLSDTKYHLKKRTCSRSALNLFFSLEIPQYYVLSRMAGRSQHSKICNHPFTGLLLLRHLLLCVKVVQAEYAQLYEHTAIIG